MTAQRDAWYHELPLAEREFVDALGDGLAQWVFDCVARKARFYRPSRYASLRACVYVPRRPTKQIVELLGDEAAARVCAAFGGEVFFFSGAALFSKRGRDESIRLLRKKGVSAGLIAEGFGLHATQVRIICRNG